MIDRVLEEVHGQRRPAGLMTGSATPASLAVKVFVEENEVFEMRVGRILRGIAMAGTRAGFIRQKDARETAR